MIKKQIHERRTVEDTLADRLKRRMAWEGKKTEPLMLALFESLQRDIERSAGEVRRDLKRIEDALEILAREFARHAAGE